MGGTGVAGARGDGGARNRGSQPFALNSLADLMHVRRNVQKSLQRACACGTMGLWVLFAPFSAARDRFGRR
jgi:hypothetical protein